MHIATVTESYCQHTVADASEPGMGSRWPKAAQSDSICADDLSCHAMPRKMAHVSSQQMEKVALWIVNVR